MATITFDGSLNIDWLEPSGYTCRLSVSSWTGGLSVTSQFQETRKPLSLIDFGDWAFFIDDPAIRAWRDTFPKDVNESIDQLPSHLSSILRWAVDSREIVDLLASNPLLIWLLVDDGLLGRASLGEINRRLGVKQRLLCASLGLVGSKQQVRILKHAANKYLSEKGVRALRELLKDEAACKFFSHSDVISDSTLEMIERFPWLVRYPIKALINDLHNEDTFRYFQDVKRMLDDLWPLYQCRTVNSLLRLHDRLAAVWNNDEDFKFIRTKSGRIKELPAPPFPGNECIEPLTSQQQIFDEATEMKHCIASFIGPVIANEFYVYRMLTPERLTIGVTMSIPLIDGDASHYQLREVRGKYNRHPTNESLKLIEAWFDGAIMDKALLLEAF